MRTAIAVLATGDYVKGARVLFHTLEKYGKLPDTVARIVLGVESCDFAQATPIQEDYSWVQVSLLNFSNVAPKLHALTLPYDRIILMDADMLCVGDCRYLWEACLSSPFYACRDTASTIYYPAQIIAHNLNPHLLFNAGTMIFDMLKLGRYFHEHLLDDIRAGLPSYDDGDQGYLNAHFQRTSQTSLGFLPPEYNECLDPYMPRVPAHAQRIIHFTGGNANPWNHRLPRSDWRMPWIRRWEAEAKEAGI